MCIDDFEIELTEEEKKAVHTVFYSFSNEGINAYMQTARFIGDDDLIFRGEDGQYSIVYSPDDNPDIKAIKDRMGRDVGIVKLDECWYQVIRV